MDQLEIFLQRQGNRFVVVEGLASNATERHVQQYQFRICTKDVTLGDIDLQQYWLDTRTVYAKKNQSPHHQALLDLWWQRCVDEGTAAEAGTCESLVLASLLPYRRDIGSRRVFLDSKLSSKNRSPVRSYRKDMDTLLRSSMDQEMSIVSFYESVRDSIGPPEYAGEFWEQFSEHKGELLDESVRLIRRGQIESGLEAAKEKWASFLKSYDRRGKSQERAISMEK